MNITKLFIASSIYILTTISLHSFQSNFDEDEQLDMDLYHAVSKRNLQDTLQEVQELITHGANVNARYFVSGLTPLIRSIQPDVEIAVLCSLLKLGANPNMADLGKKTPLMYAVIYGDLPKVNALIEAGANINAQDVSGNTALMWASFNKHFSSSIFKALLHAGANPYIENNKGTISCPPQEIGKTVFDVASKNPPIKKILDNYMKKKSKYHKETVVPKIMESITLPDVPKEIAEILTAYADFLPPTEQEEKAKSNQSAPVGKKMITND